jgi:ribosomal protein L37E
MAFHPDSMKRLARFLITAEEKPKPDRSKEQPKCKRCGDPMYEDRQYCEMCRGFEREPRFERDAAGVPPHNQERQFGQPRMEEPTDVEPTAPEDMPDLTEMEREQLAYEEAGHMDENNEIAYIAEWFAKHPGATEKDFMEAHEGVGEDPAKWAGDRRASAESPEEEDLQRRIYELISKAGDPAAAKEMMQLMQQLAKLRANPMVGDTDVRIAVQDIPPPYQPPPAEVRQHAPAPKPDKMKELDEALRYLQDKRRNQENKDAEPHHPQMKPKAQKLPADQPGRRGPVDPERSMGINNRSRDLEQRSWSDDSDKDNRIELTHPQTTFDKLPMGAVFTSAKWQSQMRTHSYYKKVDKFRAVPYKQNKPNMSPEELKAEAIAVSPTDVVMPVGPGNRGNFREMFRNQDAGERI